MDIQQIIVTMIVCLCIARIGIRIFQFFKRIKNKSNSCGCCSSNCAMKSTHSKQKCECEKNTEKPRKS